MAHGGHMLACVLGLACLHCCSCLRRVERTSGFNFTEEDEQKNAEVKRLFNEEFAPAVRESWHNEIVTPVKQAAAQAAQPTIEKVGSFLRHTSSLRKKFRNLKENFSSSPASGVVDAILEDAKLKLNASSKKELLVNFLAEVKKRADASNASAPRRGAAGAGEGSANARAALNALGHAATRQRRSLVDILQINTSDPGWQLGVKTANATKKALLWLNGTRGSGDQLGQKVLDLLHSVPEESGQKVKDWVLPFAVSNAAISDLPMTPSERAMINFGVLAGVLSKDKKDPGLSKISYEAGKKAIEDYKAANYRYYPGE